MLKTLIVLPDGTEVFSGDVRDTAIVSSTITDSVNSGTELTLGSACSSMLECKIILKDKEVLISAGDEIQLYKVSDNGTRHKIGLYTCEKPTRSGNRMLNLTAYDRVSWLDKNLAEWMNSLTEWPYSLLTFARMACEQCGVELVNDSIPNGDYQVKKFEAKSITGRQIIQWAGEIAGRFARATPDGKIEFAWYTPAQITVNPTAEIECRISCDYKDNELIINSNCLDGAYADKELNIDSGEIAASYNSGELVMDSRNKIAYYMGSFNYEDYSVKKIEKVQIQCSDKDIGTIYPDITGERNTYKITGNYLLTAHSGTELRPIAQTIYNQLKDVSYVPCKINVPANFNIMAGNIVAIKDKDGKDFTTYVMQKKQTGSKDSLECTGSRERESTTAVNNQGFEALEGKYNNLVVDADGIHTEIGDIGRSVTNLEINAEEVSTSITDLENDMNSQFEQTASDISAKVDSKRDDKSFGWSLDKDGFYLDSQEKRVFAADETGIHIDGDGNFTGKITAESGFIGDSWHIEPWGIWAGEENGYKTIMQNSGDPQLTWMFAAGGTAMDYLRDYKFRVAKDGYTVIEDGCLGCAQWGWGIDSNNLHNYDSKRNDVRLFASGVLSNGKFAKWDDIIRAAGESDPPEPEDMPEPEPGGNAVSSSIVIPCVLNACGFSKGVTDFTFNTIVDKCIDSVGHHVNVLVKNNTFQTSYIEKSVIESCREIALNPNYGFIQSGIDSPEFKNWAEYDPTSARDLLASGSKYFIVRTYELSSGLHVSLFVYGANTPITYEEIRGYDNLGYPAVTFKVSCETPFTYGGVYEGEKTNSVTLHNTKLEEIKWIFYFDQSVLGASDDLVLGDTGAYGVKVEGNPCFDEWNSRKIYNDQKAYLPVSLRHTADFSSQEEAQAGTIEDGIIQGA